MFALRHNLQASFLVYYSHDFLKEVSPSSGKELRRGQVPLTGSRSQSEVSDRDEVRI